MYRLFSMLLDRGFFLHFSWRFGWLGEKVSRWDYFTDAETEGMDEPFMAKLVAARKKTIELDPDRKGVPFRGTSWKRTLAKNQSVIGAVPNSAHLKGLAVDFRVYSSQEAGIIAKALFASGIDRIGIYVDEAMEPIHLHCDGDATKVHPDIFIKKEVKSH